METENDWFDKLFKNKESVIKGVALVGVSGYIIVFLSFILPPSCTLKLAQNTALNNYATAVSGLLGTAATIIGVAFLIYAYKDQRVQAKERRKQAESELFNKLYDDLLNDINSIQHRKSSPNGSELYNGVDALFYYSPDDVTNPNSVLNHLNLILISFEHILNLVEKSEYQDDNYRKIMRDKIYFLFYSKIHWPCKHGIYEIYGSQLIIHGWGNAKILFYKYRMLTRMAYLHLHSENLLFLTSDGKKLDEIVANKDLATNVLGETLYEILRVPYDPKADYAEIEKFWKDHKLPSSPLSGPATQPPSELRRLILASTKNEALTNKIMRFFDQDVMLEYRRLRAARKAAQTGSGQSSENPIPQT